MYTQCPQCKTIYQIDVRQLRAGRGDVFCEQCKIVFDALARLTTTVAADEPVSIRPILPVLGISESVSAADRDHALDDSLPTGLVAHREGFEPDAPDPEPAPFGWGWLLGSFALVALAALQVYLFRGERLAQDLAYRPVLAAACEVFGCSLAPYRAVKRIRVIDRGLYLAPEPIDGYEFRVLIANEAAIEQDFPRLKLTLTGGTGQPIAERIFTPAEYREPGAQPSLMPVGEPIELQLQLANPGQEIVGFSFQLL